MGLLGAMQGLRDAHEFLAVMCMCRAAKCVNHGRSSSFLVSLSILMQEQDRLESGSLLKEA